MSGRQAPQGMRAPRARTRRTVAAGPVAEAQRLDNRSCSAVYVPAHAFGRAYRTLLGHHDLTYPEYLVLREEELTVKESGRGCFWIPTR